MFLRVLRGEKTARGVSLLEVLITMAVITIGLLGVAALIPTGQFAVVEATKSDRAAACGRAGLAEVKTQRLLNPGIWAAFAPYGPSDDPSLGPAWYPFGRTDSMAHLDEPADNLRFGDAFVVDPLFIAENLTHPPTILTNVGQLASFPYDLANPPRTTPPAVWPLACLDRLAFSDLGGNGVLPLVVAERIFQWCDDLTFEIDRANSQMRTRAVYRRTGGEATAAPPILTPEDRLRQEHEGNYSWMITVQPTDIDPSHATLPRAYQVSVVVFFRRDLAYRPINPSSPPSAEDMPAERLANVVLTSGGYGGGDATLYLPVAVGNALGFADPATPVGAAQYNAYLKVKRNAWILLTGWQTDATLPNRFSPPLTPPTNWRRVAQWYRVVITDDEVQRGTLAGQDVCYRSVTLDGPDWDTGRAADQQPAVWDMTLTVRPPVGAPIPVTASAALVDGVIGVYTKTIEME